VIVDESFSSAIGQIVSALTGGCRTCLHAGKRNSQRAVLAGSRICKQELDSTAFGAICSF
jgi:hypothetical protein